MLSQLKRVVRANYSNPPTHGGQIVATVLGSPELRALWEAELATMRDRIKLMRADAGRAAARAAARTPTSASCCAQRGMFSYSGLTKAQVRAAARRILDLRDRHRPHLRRGAQFAQRRRRRRGDRQRYPHSARRPAPDFDRTGIFRYNSRLSDAGIAQLVERNLAKVEVGSSRLLSRSRFSRESPLTDAALPFRLTGCAPSRAPLAPWRGGRVVMQRPAKPSTPVRFRPPPPTCHYETPPCVRLLLSAS